MHLHLLRLMKKLFAFFLIIVYAAFIGGTLLAVPSSGNYAFEQSFGGSISNEINEPEPCNDIEAPHFSRIFKNLPGKLKLPKPHILIFSFNRFSPAANTFHEKSNFSPTYHLVHDNPLFLKNHVLRI